MPNADQGLLMKYDWITISACSVIIIAALVAAILFVRLIWYQGDRPASST